MGSAAALRASRLDAEAWYQARAIPIPKSAVGAKEPEPLPWEFGQESI